MNLTNIIGRAAVVAALAATAACTPIDDDDRLIYVKPAQVNSAVLIEDFTGQKCINCPFAATEIENIVEQYGEDHVIAVGIHCGLGMKQTATSKYQGLMTDTGNQYYAAWGRPGQPAGLINRSTDKTTGYTTWSNQVRTEIEKTAPLSLKVTNNYLSADRSLSISIDAFGTNGDTDGNLQVWLVEDSIISLQDMPTELGGGRVYNYVHNHVFRANVTEDLWGDGVSVKEGQTVKKTYTYTLPEKWEANHVAVVAFVTDTDHKNVKQVVKQPIVNK